MKVLHNLYAGIGGTVYNVDSFDLIKNIENDDTIFDLLKSREFRTDTTFIKTDAIEYLQQNIDDIDYLFASPPCPRNSRARFAAFHKKKPITPSLTMFEIALFVIHHNSNTRFVIENVIPYWRLPFFPGLHITKISKHIFISNFILDDNFTVSRIPKHYNEMKASDWKEYHNIEFDIPVKIGRNTMNSNLGKFVIDQLLESSQVTLSDFL